MAVLVLTTTYVSLNATDLSTYMKKAELAIEVAEEDVTSFSSAGWKAVTGGLKSGTLALTANDDFAVGLLDQIMYPLVGTNVAFEIRPTSAAASTSNPKWTGTVLINSHKVGGGVGEVAEKDWSLPTSGAVTRATA